MSEHKGVLDALQDTPIGASESGLVAGQKQRIAELEAELKAAQIKCGYPQALLNDSNGKWWQERDAIEAKILEYIKTKIPDCAWVEGN